MACNLKLLDRIRKNNTGIPGGGAWVWEGASGDKCGPFSTSEGTNPGMLDGDNPCLDVTGWIEGFYHFVYDTGATFHHLVIKIKNRPHAGCDSKIEVCENDSPVNFFNALNCSPDSGGEWCLIDNGGASGEINLDTGVYTPISGDGGKTIRLLYAFDAKEIDGCCDRDRCSASASLEIKVNPCGCDDLHVILRRNRNRLVVSYSGCSSSITPVYEWHKDNALLEGETGDSIDFESYGDGNYIAKVRCGDCEEEDRFLISGGCLYPDIDYMEVVDDSSIPYSVEAIVTHINPNDNITIEHRSNVTGDDYDSDFIAQYSLSLGTLSFDVNPQYGRNDIILKVENSCGEDEDILQINRDCPEANPGTTTLFRMCEGCYDEVDAIDLLEGNPDQGGEWEDRSGSESLYGDKIALDELPVGIWEFRYFVNQNYPSCMTSSSLFVQVEEEKNAGRNTSASVCHDAQDVNLLSLLSGNPDPGGSWTTDDHPDGILDLENGTFTPDDEDIGKTFTLAYSHSPNVDELPGESICTCDTFSILTITVDDCTPPPPCPDDEGLGISISEVENMSPDDPQWAEKLVASKTGAYEDSSIIESDEIYFSYDDGDTWILGDEVKDDDYYEQLLFGFSFGPTSSFDPAPPHYQWNNIRLISGEDIDMVRLTTGEGTFNQLYTDFPSGDNVRAEGTSYNMNRQRSFHLQVRHTLNSGWVMQGHYYLFTRVHENANGVGGPDSPLVRTHIRNKVSGKRKILFERRITYSIDCDPTIIEGSFNPDVPDCPPLPSNVGMSVTDPQGGFEGRVQCQGSVPGQTHSEIWQIEYSIPSDLYNTYTWTCGNPGPFDGLISLNHRYWMVRIIEMGDYCPPFFIERNYQAPTACNVVGLIQCRKDDEARVAWASRINNPTVISFDEMQYRMDSGPWMPYSHNQQIYVGDSAVTVHFRRISNYNNGCPQTTESCNVSFGGVPQPRLSLSCSITNKALNINASNLPSGGMYRIYRNGVLFRTQSNTFPVSIDRAGSYQVIYDYTYESNIVQCGEDPCQPPSIQLGQCGEMNGQMVINILGENIEHQNQLAVQITPSAPYTLFFDSDVGYVAVDAPPGSNHTIQVTATTDCGTASDSVNCSATCTSLSFSNVQCDHPNNRVTFDVITSPPSSTRPTSNGTYVSSPSNGVYRFRKSGTSGSITANHERACGPISQQVDCECPQASLSLSNVICDPNTQMLTFNVNQNNVSGVVLKINGTTRTIGSNPQSFQGASGQNTIEITGNDTCRGLLLTDSRSVNCDCNEPSIDLTSSCNNAGVVSFSFNVNNENQANGNYELLINGSPVQTINRTGAGNYSGTYSGSPGSTYTVRVRVSNVCGGATQSNQINASCGCPSSSLSISNASCNVNTQMLTFNVNQSNVSNVVLRVNGSVKTIGPNPQSFQGQIGQNSISLTGKDSCSNDDLSDGVTLNCDCSDYPSVSFQSIDENNGVFTVNFSTTNISSRSQITFIANGSTVSNISGSAGSWSANFPAINGDNDYDITVTNNCGTDSISGYEYYSPCVPPSIVRVNQSIVGGALRVTFSTSNCESITSTPGSTVFLNCNSNYAEFMLTGGVVNWTITVQNSCGTDSISGTYDSCADCSVSISSRGCQQQAGMSDIIFLVDNSGSIDSAEFTEFRNSIRATIDQLSSSGIDARYSIAQYTTALNVTTPFTSNASTAKNFDRHYANGCDDLNQAFGLLRSHIGSTLNVRPQATKHIVLFTDAVDSVSFCSQITPFTNRNALVGDGWNISVAKYPDGYFPEEIPKHAANATIGGSYTGEVAINPGDPNGSQMTPRRLYVRNSFDGLPVPGLAADIISDDCFLTATATNCPGASYNWSASNGGAILSGQNTREIKTNGSGRYTVTVTYGGNCQTTRTYNY